MKRKPIFGHRGRKVEWFKKYSKTTASEQLSANSELR